MQTRRAVMVGSLCLLSFPSRLFAQAAWPQRPVKLIVPLAAGGGVDLMARIMAERLSDTLGQQVVVENQGGAGGTIAAGIVARSEPDGYTLIFESVSSAVINALVYKHLAYDPVADFTPVSLFARFPLVAVISAQIPANNLREFIALLKANPGKYSYGSSGVGTITHLAGELFKSLAQVDMVHVPYRGNSAAVPDLIAGRVALMFDGVAPQLPFIRDGKVKALGVTTKERSPVLPDVPAIDEILPGFEVPFWTGAYAPAKTPRKIVDRLASDITEIAKEPAVIKRLAALGVEPVGSTPAEFDRFWHDQLDYYAKIVKANNISVGP